jgi:hypothetical protein
MSIRNLDKVFAPSSVALIGASMHPGTVGAVTLANLRRSSFQGRLHLVNPRHASLDGLQVMDRPATRRTDLYQVPLLWGRAAARSAPVGHRWDCPEIGGHAALADRSSRLA